MSLAAKVCWEIEPGWAGLLFKLQLLAVFRVAATLLALLLLVFPVFPSVIIAPVYDIVVLVLLDDAVDEICLFPAEEEIVMYDEISFNYKPSFHARLLNNKTIHKRHNAITPSINLCW